MVYPSSVAYLAMDGAAAPKGVTFGGGTKSDSFNGSAFDDVITTGGGLSNYVMAFSGDDMVVGGDGKDFIRTGQNASSPTFKDNDIAFGGENRDVLMGGGGDGRLWGGCKSKVAIYSRTARLFQASDWRRYAGQRLHGYATT